MAERTNVATNTTTKTWIVAGFSHELALEERDPTLHSLIAERLIFRYVS